MDSERKSLIYPETDLIAELRSAADECHRWFAEDKEPSFNCALPAFLNEAANRLEALPPTSTGEAMERRERDPRFQWCQPVVAGKPQERVWVVRFEDQDRPDITFTGPSAETEARDYWHRANVAWNCYLLTSAPQVPDALIASDALAPTAGTGEGWRTVPNQPTREMWAAMGDALFGYKQRHHDKVAADVWNAALAASPPPEVNRLDADTIRTSPTTGVRTYWETGPDGEPQLVNEPITLPDNSAPGGEVEQGAIERLTDAEERLARLTADFNDLLAERAHWKGVATQRNELLAEEVAWKETAEATVTEQAAEIKRLHTIVEERNDLLTYSAALKAERDALAKLLKQARGWVVTCTAAGKARDDLKAIDAALTPSEPTIDGDA
jgi:hypothetical protein